MKNMMDKEGNVFTVGLISH